MNKKWIVVAALSCVTATTCAAQSFSETDLQESWKTGQSWQEMKLMSQKDYVVLRLIAADVRDKKIISNRDLEWTVSLLKETREPLAHVRIMTVFSNVGNCSQTQKDQILKAIAPFLNVEKVSRLESDAAVKIHGRIQRVSIVPENQP